MWSQCGRADHHIASNPSRAPLPPSHKHFGRSLVIRPLPYITMFADKSNATIPAVGNRAAQVDADTAHFLHHEGATLHLGGRESFNVERSTHSRVLSITAIPSNERAPIHRVEMTGFYGPHGTIPVRVLYPSSGQQLTAANQSGALIYFHGGGYTVGSVDEFEQGLRVIAEASTCQVYAVDYRLAPEWQYPVQLEEYEAVLDWVRSKEGGGVRGVDPKRVAGGGDSAGGNMTAALTLRLHDRSKPNLAVQLLLYPEARLPFDTPAATENNSGYYLECNGIFSFADHYLPRGIPPATRDISPGMQPVDALHDLPPAVVFTAGFDPLRDVGVEYAHKLQAAGNQVQWLHQPELTHGFIQMTRWSEKCRKATEEVGHRLKQALLG